MAEFQLLAVPDSTEFWVFAAIELDPDLCNLTNWPTPKHETLELSTENPQIRDDLLLKLQK